MTCLVLDLEQGSAGFCACDAAGKPELRREFGGHSAGDLWARCVSLLGGALEARLEEVNRRMTNYLRSDRLRDSACLGELTCAQAEQALAPVKEQLTALLEEADSQIPEEDQEDMKIVLLEYYAREVLSGAPLLPDERLVNENLPDGPERIVSLGQNQLRITEQTGARVELMLLGGASGQEKSLLLAEKKPTGAERDFDAVYAGYLSISGSVDRLAQDNQTRLTGDQESAEQLQGQLTALSFQKDTYDNFIAQTRTAIQKEKEAVAQKDRELKDLSRQHAEVLSRKNKAEKEKAGRQKEIEAAENEIHSYEEQVRNMDSQLERLTHAAAQAKQNYEDLPSYGEGGKRVLYTLDHLPEQYRRLLPGRAAAEEERSGPENTDRQDRPDQSPGGVAEKDRMNLSRKTLGRPRKDYSYDRDFGDQVKSVALIRGFAARGGGTGSGSFGGRLSDDLNELNPSLYQGFVSSVQKKNGLDRINTNMEAKRSRPERVT